MSIRVITFPLVHDGKCTPNGAEYESEAQALQGSALIGTSLLAHALHWDGSPDTFAARLNVGALVDLFAFRLYRSPRDRRRRVKDRFWLSCFYAQEVSLRRDNIHIVDVAFDVIEGTGASV